MEENFNELYEFDQSNGTTVAGVDEAGRGPLAGPVVAAAVVIEKYVPEFKMIDDSKKLSEKKRELLFDAILENCKVGVGIVNSTEIDKLNILNATFLAMKNAISELTEEGVEFSKVLVDGNHKIRGYSGQQEAIVKGDSKSLCIAAASIIAKVTRDKIMEKYAVIYPEYGFEKHKGYGTKQHRDALLKYGSTDIHRKSFLTKILAKTLF